jgi:hypothetical protein
LTLALVAGCGGNDDEDLDRAREEGARQARLQERQKQQRERQRELEKKIKELEEKQRQGGSSAGGSSGGTAAPSTGGRTSCGDGLTVGPNTTCAFARVVRAEYQRTGSGTVEAYSPVTERTYTMSCSHGSPHVCVGGNNASVYFP